MYLAHPISGLSFAEVEEYYNRACRDLQGYYDILYPIIAKAYLRNEQNLKAYDYLNPISTNHAIVGRDSWMVRSSDVVFVDLSGAKAVSIGSCMEIAWAHMLGKHVIVVMEQNNIHRHAFVLECADIVFETYDEAVAYLVNLEMRTVGLNE